MTSDRPNNKQCNGHSDPENSQELLMIPARSDSISKRGYKVKTRHQTRSVALETPAPKQSGSSQAAACTLPMVTRSKHLQ